MADSKLKGMRELNQEEIQVMNDIADLGNKFGELINQIGELGYPLTDQEEYEPPVSSDQRWLNNGKTHMQIGIMCLKRAIGKPDNF